MAAVAGIALVASGRSAPPLTAAVRVRPTCSQWLAETVKAAEKAERAKSRDRILAALPGACNAIPAGLQTAAAKALRTKEPGARAQILAQAAQAVLGATCAVVQPLDNAQKLASACPLPPVRAPARPVKPTQD